MRAFFCLELESDFRRLLHEKMSHLRHSRAKVSWVKPDNLHITMKFLGEIDQQSIEDLERVAAHVIAESGVRSKVALEVNKLGAFPSLKRPRVLWAGSQSAPSEISDLANQLSGELDLMGYKQDNNRFTPHVTLGRIKDEGRPLAELVELVDRTPPFSLGSNITGLTLMESQLSPQGSIYKPIFVKQF